MTDVKLIAGDTLQSLAKLKSESLDLVIADPPYNLGKDFGNNHDQKDFDDYLAFSRAWSKEAVRVLKPTGTIYVFMGFRFISYMFDILSREHGLHFNSWIVWHYTQGIGRTRGFSPRHDDILMFTKSAAFTFNLDHVRIPQKFYRQRNNMRGANPGDVWEFSHVHYCNANRQSHPTQKPEGLIERMVLASSNPGDAVLDPFCGSGTTLRVCQQTGRRCLGIEINPEYVELSKKRLSEPFHGFDSVDPRATRLPYDLRDPDTRKQYFENHKKWFLRHHENALDSLERAISRYHPGKDVPSQESQMPLFEPEEEDAQQAAAADPAPSRQRG